MARKKSSKAKRKLAQSFTYPSLHEEIENAVDSTVSPWFCKDNNGGAEREYTTHVMGKFSCVNQTCCEDGWGWGSKKVAIVIRSFSDDGYNAEVFNQRCKWCGRLGLFTLDEKSYVERVVYRIQKWAGIHVEETPYFKRKRGLPHQRRFCEGCKRGYCQDAEDDDDD